MSAVNSMHCKQFDIGPLCVQSTQCTARSWMQDICVQSTQCTASSGMQDIYVSIQLNALQAVGCKTSTCPVHSMHCKQPLYKQLNTGPLWVHSTQSGCTNKTDETVPEDRFNGAARAAYVSSDTLEVAIIIIPCP